MSRSAPRAPKHDAEQAEHQAARDTRAHRRIGAEREPDPESPAARADVVRHHAIHADRREQPASAPNSDDSDEISRG